MIVSVLIEIPTDFTTTKTVSKTVGLTFASAGGPPAPHSRFYKYMFAGARGTHAAPGKTFPGGKCISRHGRLHHPPLESHFQGRVMVSPVPENVVPVKIFSDSNWNLLFPICFLKLLVPANFTLTD